MRHCSGPSHKGVGRAWPIFTHPATPASLSSPAEANLLFGRGFRAGIDRREQKKAADDAEAELLRRNRRDAGVEETAEDRARDKERAAYADKYEGADMRVDSHWSDKKLEDMTERDWRIFRCAPGCQLRVGLAGCWRPQGALCGLVGGSAPQRRCRRDRGSSPWWVQVLET